MSAVLPMAYRCSRWVLKVVGGFYFARIEQFHRERVPVVGPVLFVSNHPNSVTDAFVIGMCVPRKVNFVATIQLFRLAPLRWLLSHLGVIPINRMKDDPRAMRTVFETFAACFRVLERGEAIGIFPEGITHDDPQLKTVKTGAARMALELESRHGGTLGLQIVPVGLTFSAKERYRSDVLVNFGAPIRAANFLEGYTPRKHDCIQALTAEIERRIESLILHLPKLERARVVEAVKRLYLERLLVGNRVIHEPIPPNAGELLLSQAIASAVDFTYEQHAQEAVDFVKKLDRYERRLKRFNLSDDELAHFAGAGRMAMRSLAWSLEGVVLFPVAVYGWLHRLLPVCLVNWAIRRFAQTAVNKTHVSTTAILAGTVSFGLTYAACIAIVHKVFGWPVSLWYALSLPVASLVAHHYLRGARRFVLGLRHLFLQIRAPSAARHLLKMREELIARIEAARWKVPDAVLTPGGKALHEAHGS